SSNRPRLRILPPQPKLMNPEGVNFDSFYTLRTQTVNKLSQALNDLDVLLVKGTPYCGKTGLAQLLARQLAHSTTAHIVSLSMIEAIDTDYNFEKHFSKWVGMRFGEYVQMKEDRYFLLDEAQISYDTNRANSSALWDNTIKRVLGGRAPGLRVACFAAYDSMAATSSPTPYQLSTNHIVSLHPKPNLTFPLPGLLLTPEEVNEMCTSFTDRGGFPVSKDLADYLWHVTGGHVGLLKSILTILSQVTVISFFAAFGDA
ncbi:hypothetical protein HK097_002464, partial [Rhizophlyctis rosea]